MSKIPQKQMTCAIVLNGIEPQNSIREHYIICADGGYNLVPRCDIVIGDFDSSSVLDCKTETLVFPAKKDKTDGEICIDFAKEKGFTDIVIYAATGGRIDHILANINLLGYADYQGIDAKIVDKNLSIFFCKDKKSIEVTQGSTVSIIPKTNLEKLSISGVEYPLVEYPLVEKYSSFTMSNVANKSEISISHKGESFIVITHK